MRLFVVSAFICFSLAGCGSLVQSQNTCSAQSQSYLSMWNCIQGKVADNQAGMMNNDLGVKYMAYGDLLAEKVRTKQITDAEAKSYLARELSSSNGEFERRKSAAIQDFVATVEATQRRPNPTLDCTSSRVGSTIRTTCD